MCSTTRFLLSCPKLKCTMWLLLLYDLPNFSMTYHPGLQIDELVVQALKVTSKKGRKEIESFADVLSEMQTSLKVDTSSLNLLLYLSYLCSHVLHLLHWLVTAAMGSQIPESSFQSLYDN